jgi:hypothetical protein
MFICLYAPAWPDLSSSPLPAELLALVPRITIGTDVVWADARGLPAHQIAIGLIARAVACGIAEMRAGVARIAIAAELAAKTAQPQTAVMVDGDERSFIAPIPLNVFAGHDKLLTLLDGVGVRTCGELAALDREAVEVRFGAEAVGLWQWSRAEDVRRVFSRTAPEHLHAATDFVDYVVTDPERLIFVANALFASVCDQLRARGEHARRVLLTLSLGDRTSWQRTIRPARPTASRAVWLRLTRALLERLTVADAVTGVMIEVMATEPATAVQGDLFDPGFATAAAVDSAVARLIELQGNIVVQPQTTRHPLAEQRTEWQTEPNDWVQAPNVQTPDLPVAQPAELQLRLLSQPREILVETINRRDHVLPIRFRDGQWQQIVTAAGPDRISGGKWDSTYAREYFRAVTVTGDLVWIYRDAREDRWFLHGYWD